MSKIIHKTISHTIMGKNKTNSINIERTKEERQSEVRNIISKLNELNLTIIHEEIFKLMKIMQKYINNGEHQNINIEFPAINKYIVGKLTKYIDEPVWVKLTNK